MFSQKVDQFAQRHQLFSANSTILVAVSGGPDSMALLHYLKSREQRFGIDLVVLTIDHSLRGVDSKEDVHYVSTTCKKWDIKCETVTLDVPSFKEEHGLGTQEAARKLRYRYFSDQMRKHHADFLAMGHHGDDQVETILMEMVRGAEPSSIRGIPVYRSFSIGQIIRPLLCVTKQEIEAYCEEVGITPRIDESNKSTTYTRNAMRAHVLPVLKSHNPKVHEHMQYFQEYQRDDEAYMMQESKRIFESSLFDKKDHEIQFNRSDFLNVPSPLQRRTFHLILNYLYQEPSFDVTYHHWEQYIRIVKDKTPQAIMHLPRGLSVVRSYENIVFTFKKEEAVPFHYLLHVPGELVLPDGAYIYADQDDHYRGHDSHHFACDISNVTLPLIVRTRKPGDKFIPKGMKGRKKVKDLFIDEKVPHEQRSKWPIVTDANGQILWVVSLKEANIPVNQQHPTWLHLTYENHKNF
ncbi:tRNA lysidine(34) synthetase TilS [Pontibacillus sp. HN14]|uniref:tRNA lysidine(34) synthetase TilS n=1 Tax=Pontibacillus sp. HN14 TaxID=2898421 RepID=UPI001E4444AD|nr:tRNA lysidine(34) synthetase TilS [Pontibacillus sp. HN14]MCD5326115.1 tRNA lysidine(34) synthetase TilS [Pontibacillus sp. HN14]